MTDLEDGDDCCTCGDDLSKFDADFQIWTCVYCEGRHCHWCYIASGVCLADGQMGWICEGCIKSGVEYCEICGIFEEHTICKECGLKICPYEDCIKDLCESCEN